MSAESHRVDERQPEKAGWRPREWARAAGLSRASVYNLLAAKQIASVKYGGARIIVTTPAQFLASLRDDAAE
jgi:hypothetical protein